MTMCAPAGDVMLGEGACCNMLRSMKRLQSPFKRTVVLDGHKTSINVEPEFWDQLRLITLERRLPWLS
jgi:predicted DNA-binding ribbon-helix-helix protein